MIKDATDEPTAVYAYRLVCNSPFDPAGMINSVYSKLEKTSRVGFTYLVKIRAHSDEDARTSIRNEIDIQLYDDHANVKATLLNTEYYV